MAGQEESSSSLFPREHEKPHGSELGKSQLDVLQESFQEVKICMHKSEQDAKKEIEVLWRRVKTAATVLSYLKSKAQVMAVPELSYAACGIRQSEGVDGLVDRDGVPLTFCSRNVDFDISSFGCPDEYSWTRIDEHDNVYIEELLNSANLVTEVMESLVQRAAIAESETLVHKERVSFGQEEIKRKTAQIESMSFKLGEMEKFASGTNDILNEMKQRVEDLVEETTMQRQRAAENDLELCRVKRDFESLKSYVNSLISVRETLPSPDKFQVIERLLERLMLRTTQLESEKSQKDAEVNKLVEENVRLTALLDKKEAELLAMNEQFKVMALSNSRF
ncbi:hypothetical protein SAY86_031353 [Trapa natans]|uniref:Uncharacterized protein n=1 Tax=Trapa natans TaxID=22666 RepID=A0AAN7R7B9_TRANT|nr:hypothetical protein SAY86_031353 [Trapa natans]